MRKKVVLVFFAVVNILTLIAGCASGPHLPKDLTYQSRHGIVFRGAMSNDEARRLDKILDIFDEVPDVIKSVKSISANNIPGHIEKEYESHCHYSRDICMRPSRINNDQLIWHEVGHAYNFYLNQTGKNFSNEWQELAGDVYQDPPKNRIYPRDGVLSQYGSRNYKEDIAVYVSEFYVTIDGRLSDFIFLENPWVKKDSRYFRKVELLRKYGFVSERDYRKFLSKGYLKRHK